MFIDSLKFTLMEFVASKLSMWVETHSYGTLATLEDVFPQKSFQQDYQQSLIVSLA